MESVDSTNIVCGICSRQFSSELNFSIHYRGHLSNKSLTEINHFEKPFSVDASASESDLEEMSDKPVNDVVEQPKKPYIIHMNRQIKNTARKTLRSKSGTRSSSKLSTFKGYLCPVCQEFFLLESKFHKHCLAHLEAKEISSDASEQSLVESHSVDDEHSNQPSEESSDTYKVCNDELASNIELLIHSQTQKKKEKFSCSTCGKMFFRKASLVIHQSCHVKIFSCEICKMDFNSELLLAVHKQSHCKSKGYSCKICFQSFPEKIALQEHYGEHNLKKIRCEFCGKRFATKNDFNKHLSVHLKETNHDFETSEFENEPNYSCDTCDKTFPSKDKLQTHQLIHIEADTMFPCKDCERVFPFEHNLRIHELKCHPRKEGDYVCDKCGKKFVSSGGYYNHYAEHIYPDKLCCSVCGEKCKNKHALYVHRKSKHGSNVSFSCTECPKVFRFKRNLTAHMMVHVAFKPYVCNICDKRFRVIKNLNKHRMIHTDKKPYVCYVCNKGFRQKGSLKLHSQVHTGEKPFLCNVCGLRYSTNQTLKNHICAKHLSRDVCDGDLSADASATFCLNNLEDIDEDNLFCKKCRKMFPSKEMLETHRLSHVRSSDLIPCSECERVFTSDTSLKMHLNFHKNEEFSCDQCGAKFRKKTTLRNHIATHADPDKFLCGTCGEKFHNKETLERHRRSAHMPSELLPCSQCPKKCPSKSALKLHQKIYHSGTKPYACNVCDKRFSILRYLNKHLIVHTGKRPFVCDICDKAFAQRPNLISHKRIHSGEKQFACEACGIFYSTKRALKHHLAKHSGDD